MVKDKTLTPPTLPLSISLLANSLLYTLKDCQNIPLHLGVVYLMFAEKEAYLRINDFKLKRYLFDSGYHYQHAAYLEWNNFGVGFNESIYDQRVVVNKIMDLGDYEKNFWLDTKCFFTNPPVNPKKILNYVYSRNVDIVDPLNQLVEYFDRTYQNIPYFLVYPYLELNRDKAIKTNNDFKNNNKYEVGFLRYDKQNQTLKWKKNLLSKKYSVQHPGLVLKLYDRPGEWGYYVFTLPKAEDRKFWDYDAPDYTNLSLNSGVEEDTGKPSHTKAKFSGGGMVLDFSTKT